MTPTRSFRPSIGPVSVALMATVFWTAGGTIAKSSPLGGPQLAFWRSLMAALVYSLVTTLKGERPTLSSIRRSAVGGVGFGLSVTLIFVAYRMTSFVSANVIGALQPVLLIPLSARLMGERTRARGVALMCLAVVGTIIVQIGSSLGGNWSLRGDLVALASMVVGCGYSLGTRAARRTLSTMQYQASAMVAATVATLPGAVTVGSGWVWPGAGELGSAALLVAVGGTGHLLYTWAQGHLPVPTVSTLVLLEIPELAVVAVVFFDESFRWSQAIGIAIVISAISAFVRYEADTVVPAIGAVAPPE